MSKHIDHKWVEFNNILMYHSKPHFEKYIGAMMQPLNAEVSNDKKIYSSSSDSTYSSYCTESDEDDEYDEELCLPPLKEIFDLDGTLIDTKSEKTFPVDEHDYTFMPGVLDFFKKVATNSDYFLCIISNQGGLKKSPDRMTQFKMKIETIVTKINTIFENNGNILHVFMMCSLDLNVCFYRKPYPDTWRTIQQFLPLQEVYEPVKYIGDAAGRKDDHSADDRKFAMNANLVFNTPEQFFQDAAEEPYLIDFDPRNFIYPSNCIPNSKEHIPNFSNIFTSELPTKYLILMMGYPGSGKSTFARHLKNETKKYCKMTILSQDQLGKFEAVQREMGNVYKTASKTENHGVIIDGLNHRIDKRSGWITFAKNIDPEIQVYIFEMTTSQNLSRHMNIIRARSKNNSHSLIPKIVYNSYSSKYEPVSTTVEEISGHYKIPFIASFNNDATKLMNFLLLTT
jgi:bifunctional polynucleotide phosphatase/kinase